jgi:DNA-binding MarR family transcriptional regulator
MTNTTKRTTSDEAIALLGALHDLSRATRPIDLGVLAGRLGWGVGRVVRVLAHLERKGLADRARCRLTLAGLAVAAVLATNATASAA